MTSPNIFPGRKAEGGCSCASCAETDKYHYAGFANWPKGQPAGPRASAAAYAAHVAHGKSGGCTGSHFTIKPEPVFVDEAGTEPRTGYASAFPAPTALVANWIARSYAWSGMAEHFPAGGGAASVRSRSVPRLLGVAQRLRAERRQERKAA